MPFEIFSCLQGVSFQNVSTQIQEGVTNAAHKIDASIQEGYRASVRMLDSACRKNFNMSITEVARKVQHIAMHAFITITTALFFLANSSLFVIGAMMSFLDNVRMEEAIDRIVYTWGKQDFSTRAVVTIAALMAWPVTFAASAFFLGANFSLSLQNESENGHVQPSEFDPHPHPHRV